MLQLVPIGPDNHLAARALTVDPAQERFVASVDKSLADAYVYQTAEFRIACIDETPVGYVLVFPFQQQARQLVNIVRLMIDARFQGRGHGRQLLQATLEWIGTFSPAVDTIRIATLPDNAAALSLYKSLGFVEQGIEDGEIALYRSAVPG